jgi:hypothetical protein
MGYAVLHLDKASGSDAAMSSHIERNTQQLRTDYGRN